MGFVCLFVCFSSFSRLSIMSQVAIDSARHHDPLSSSTNTPWARRFKKSYSPSSSTSTPAVYVAKPVTFIGEVPYAPEGAKANRRFQGAWLVRDDGHINQTVEKQQQQSADDSVAETVPILVVPDGDGEQREGPRSPSHQTPDPIAESSYSTHSGGSGSDIASPDIDYSAPRLPPYPPPPQILPRVRPGFTPGRSQHNEHGSDHPYAADDLPTAEVNPEYAQDANADPPGPSTNSFFGSIGSFFTQNGWAQCCCGRKRKAAHPSNH